MIKRHLTGEQRAVLEGLAEHPAPACTIKARQLTYSTLCYLKREKLVVNGSNGVYAITEAGRAALESGLYDKQPHLLIMPASVKKADDGRTAHLTYTTGPRSA